MREATYFFTTEAFKTIPYGDMRVSSKRLDYADIVIRDGNVIKHPQKTVPFNVNKTEIEQIKANFNGVIVNAPIL